MNSGILIVSYGIILAALVMLVRWEFVRLRKGPSLEDVRQRVEKQQQILRAAHVNEAHPREAHSRWETGV